MYFCCHPWAIRSDIFALEAIRSAVVISSRRGVHHPEGQRGAPRTVSRYVRRTL